MSVTWTVRTSEEKDQINIINLINLVYPRFDKKYLTQYWRWEYERNPLGCLVAVAEHMDQLIGHAARITFKMKIGNKIVRSAQGVDLVIHPHFRRKGISLALGKFLADKAVEEIVPVWYAFANEPAYHGELKYGWFLVGEIPNLVRIFNFHNIFLSRYPALEKAGFILKFVSKLAELPFNFLTNTASRKLSTPKDLKILEVLSFDQRINEFWDDVATNYKVILVRDKNYLNWRYFEKPNGEYKVFIAQKGGNVLGYIVLAIEKIQNLRIGIIVDILTTNNDITRHLVHKAIRFFSDMKVDKITCWMLKNCIYYNILKENGFLPTFRKTKLTARLNLPQSNLSLLQNLDNWYVTMGDSDLV